MIPPWVMIVAGSPGVRGRTIRPGTITAGITLVTGVVARTIRPTTNKLVTLSAAKGPEPATAALRVAAGSAPSTSEQHRHLRLRRGVPARPPRSGHAPGRRRDCPPLPPTPPAPAASPPR